ncbi:MAG TPA: hypothetical protein VG871_06555, partial [Vicinamibacterales bacterium]|nr:hypothetical protein [Vicinamibacterales bacterium]
MPRIPYAAPIVLVTLLASSSALSARQAPAASGAQDVGDPGWTMSTFPEMNWPKGKIPEANAMVDEAV